MPPIPPSLSSPSSTTDHSKIPQSSTKYQIWVLTSARSLIPVIKSHLRSLALFDDTHRIQSRLSRVVVEQDYFNFHSVSSSPGASGYGGREAEDREGGDAALATKSEGLMPSPGPKNKVPSVLAAVPTALAIPIDTARRENSGLVSAPQWKSTPAAFPAEVLQSLALYSLVALLQQQQQSDNEEELLLALATKKLEAESPSKFARRYKGPCAYAPLKDEERAGFRDSLNNISSELYLAAPNGNPGKGSSNSKLFTIIHSWISSSLLPSPFRTSDLLHPGRSYASWNYTIYPPLLLLPMTSALQSAAWKGFLTSGEPCVKVCAEEFWQRVCEELGVSHVGVNGVIPARLEKGSGMETKVVRGRRNTSEGSGGEDSDIEGEAEDEDEDGQRKDTDAGDEENVLRSPTAFKPLWGDFGPLPSSSAIPHSALTAKNAAKGDPSDALSENSPSLTSHPLASVLASTFWATVCQYGIHQVFAPVHTMFSRGNIDEKRRIVQDFRTGTTAPSQPFTAVDLYAGIGYFAFSYAKLGAAKVLCWEISGWSVEGLKRGAGRNGWGCEVFPSPIHSESVGMKEEDEKDDDDNNDNDYTNTLRKALENNATKFLIFHESNKHALRLVRLLRAHGHPHQRLLPPVTHVNCGYLPTSKPVWGLAVALLDRECGGWVHAHENVQEGEEEVEKRRREVEKEMLRAWVELGAEVELERRSSLVDSGDMDVDMDMGMRETVTPRVKCENVKRVKTYAPGVMHCVFDVRVDFQERGGETEAEVRMRIEE